MNAGTDLISFAYEPQMTFRFHWKKGMWFYLGLTLVMLIYPGNTKLYAVVPAVLSLGFYLMKFCQISLTEQQLVYQNEFSRVTSLNLKEIRAIKFTVATLAVIPFGAMWSIAVYTPSQSMRIPTRIVHQKQFLESLCFRTGLPQPDIPYLFSGNNK